MPSLIVKLPLPSRFGGPKRDAAATTTPSLIVKLRIGKRPGDDMLAPAAHKATKKARSPRTLTTTFLAYLENTGTPGFEETTALAAIEAALVKMTTSLPGLLAGQPPAPYFASVLGKWVAYRSVLDAVRASHDTPLLLAEVLSRFTIKIKNSRLLTELRVARREYVETETGELGVDEVLSRGFGALLKSVDKGVEVCEWVAERLEEMVVDLGALGDELGEGAGRWVVMGGGVYL